MEAKTLKEMNPSRKANKKVLDSEEKNLLKSMKHKVAKGMELKHGKEMSYLGHK